MLEKQQTAVQELRDIESTSNNGIELVTSPHFDVSTQTTVMEISIDCSSFEMRGNNHLSLSQRERVVIFLDKNYPFSIPIVAVFHNRFITSAHVQWMREFEKYKAVLPTICLYQSPSNDWEPSEGMFGLMDRLVKWFARGAVAELDLPGDPIHAPLAYYSQSNPIRIVLSKNAPTVGRESWIGYFKYKRIKENIYEVVDFIQDTDIDDSCGLGCAFLLPHETFFEFPNQLDHLIKLITNHGNINQSTIASNMAKVQNRIGKNFPLFVMVGSPMRGIAGEAERKLHLAIGDISAQAITDKTDLNSINWCKSYENREEIIIKRDNYSNITSLRDKNILLIGVGGLGGYAAESIVRSGAKKITVVDFGEVHPGLLSRQNYTHEDIGKPKVEAIRDRITKVNPNCEVTIINNDFLTVADSIKFEDFDFIINLSASNPINLYFEQLSKTKRFPTVAVGLISADAKVLLGTISDKTYIGGQKQLLRNFHIRMLSDRELEEVTKKIWPEPGNENNFQPEPGCSEPTFTGSATDMQFLSSFFINQISEYFGQQNTTSGRLFGIHQPTNGITKTWSFFPECYQQFDISDNDAKVRISSKSLAQLKSHVAKAQKLRGSSCETGGLMYGRVENAIDLIWVDECTDAPSNSEFSASGFHCGTNGVEELSKKISKATNGESCFIGYWHTHPNGPTKPSFTDLLAAFETVSTSGENLRQVLFMIINPDNFSFDFYFFDHVNGQLRIVIVRE